MTAYSTIIQGCRKDAPGAQAEFYDLHAQRNLINAKVNIEVNREKKEKAARIDF